MRIVFFTFFLFFSVSSFAQNKVDHSAIIDQQVWEPFKKSYSKGDAALFNSLHTYDVIRITQNGIRQGKDYKEVIVKAYSNPNRSPRTIDFVFEHRIHEDNIAYEVGYYKVIYEDKEGVQQKSFGRFSVVLRKVNGCWKIAQDWDTSNINGVPVTEKDFQRLLKE